MLRAKQPSNMLMPSLDLDSGSDLCNRIPDMAASSSLTAGITASARLFPVGACKLCGFVSNNIALLLKPGAD
eukprot:scaffold460358_cov39-Prasinocladus_malaysianus.AAC.1